MYPVLKHRLSYSRAIRGIRAGTLNEAQSAEGLATAAGEGWGEHTGRVTARALALASTVLLHPAALDLRRVDVVGEAFKLCLCNCTTLVAKKGFASAAVHINVVEMCKLARMLGQERLPFWIVAVVEVGKLARVLRKE